MPPALKRSIAIRGHRTSVTLEAPFWVALEEIAAERGLALAALIAEIDQARTQTSDGEGGTLASALRVFILEAIRLRSKA